MNAQYARGETSLVPGYEEVKRKQIMEFRSPRDMAGAKDMSISYVDHYKKIQGGYTCLHNVSHDELSLLNEPVK